MPTASCQKGVEVDQTTQRVIERVSTWSMSWPHDLFRNVVRGFYELEQVEKERSPSSVSKAEKFQ